MDIAEGRGPGSMARYAASCRGLSDWTAVWIAYLNSTQPMALRSSEIIVIDKATGEVRYRGSAWDEG